MRNTNTNRHGGPWDEKTKRAVWQKSRRLDDNRHLDSCGAIMQWDQHGNTHSAYGWEIDHIKPVAAGGSDDLENLQPLQWENNRFKGDSWPQWFCKRAA